MPTSLCVYAVEKRQNGHSPAAFVYKAVIFYSLVFQDRIHFSENQKKIKIIFGEKSTPILAGN